MVTRLPRSEGDDPADRVVRGNPHRDSIAWHHLDPETAHSPAQLRQYFVAAIDLNAIQPSAVHRHDRPLHIYEVVFAQKLVLSALWLASSVPHLVVSRNVYRRLLLSQRSGRLDVRLSFLVSLWG